ncbi:flavin reductase [Kribbella sp. VKM Ac-2566]|uniref:flavin reductase n=1 Tax=Kribbella sp. VKM Ac-2566 TaxID=2512218 RepID=UPI00106341AA|nr:flavin reductase [Kribbella sp. VKM Ac-2566]TDX08270.1 DNA-binding GntR family transcriptional regulator [Kribbella sp. VKM Ac-2566]
MTIDSTTFRYVVGHFMTGVTVITANDGGMRHGVTASSVASLSVEPPTMIACVNKASRTGQAIYRSGYYAINILNKDQGPLAERFASSADDKFSGLDVAEGFSGAPLLPDVLAQIECQVVEAVEGGTHRVLIGAVLAATAGAGDPLGYYRGGFGEFHLHRDDAVYEEIRRQIIQRNLRPGAIVDIPALAKEFDVGAGVVRYALARLATDTLITRDPRRGYMVAPIDAATCAEAFDARCTIELGVVARIAGRPTKPQLEQLDARLAELMPLIRAGRFVDVRRYVEANNAYHEQVVSLAGSESLLGAYRRLSLKGLMTLALSGVTDTSDDMIGDHIALTDALKRGDEAAARTALISHNARVKTRTEEILRSAGGRI